MKRKLEHFRKKIETLERNIYQSEQRYRPVQLPKSFLMRRHSKEEHREGKKRGERELGYLRNELEIQKRKYSMPNLAKISTYRYGNF